MDFILAKSTVAITEDNFACINHHFDSATKKVHADFTDNCLSVINIKNHRNFMKFVMQKYKHPMEKPESFCTGKIQWTPVSVCSPIGVTVNFVWPSISEGCFRGLAHGKWNWNLEDRVPFYSRCLVWCLWEERSTVYQQIGIKKQDCDDIVHRQLNTYLRVSFRVTRFNLLRVKFSVDCHYGRNCIFIVLH